MAARTVISKVRAFYHSIIGDRNSVVIDRHALSAAYGVFANEKANHDFAGSRVWYDLLVSQYCRAADLAHVDPAQFQAVVWVVWRNRKKEVSE